MTEQDTTGKTGLLGQFEQAGKIVALFGSVLLAISVFYDYSFLLALGLTFADVPTTVADHVRSAIVWAPSVIVLGGGGFLLGWWTHYLEGGKSEAEIVAGSRHPVFVARFRKSGHYAYLLGIGSVSLSAFLSRGPLMWLYVIFVVLWTEIIDRFVSSGPLKFSKQNGIVVLILPMVFALVGGIGYLRGDEMLRADSPKWVVETKTDRGIETRRYLGLRRFNSAAVAVDLHREVHVVFGDAMIDVKPDVPGDDLTANRACRYFSVACLAPPTTAANPQPAAPSPHP